MSTKKNKDNGEIKLSKEQIKKIAKKVANDHKNDPKPQLLIPDNGNKKTDLSKIAIPEKFVGKNDVTVATLHAVRWINADPNTIRREVKIIEIKMSFEKDVDYTMGDVQDFIEKKRKILNIGEGWCFSEEEAIKCAITDITMSLGTLEGRIIDHQECPINVLAAIRKTIKSLSKLNTWRSEIVEIRKNANGDNAVIPDLNRWFLNANREWQRREKIEKSEIIDGCIIKES